MLRRGERRISLKELQTILKRDYGVRRTYLTIWRWARQGVKGRKLETVDAGGRVETSIEAYERFERNGRREE